MTPIQIHKSETQQLPFGNCYWQSSRSINQKPSHSCPLSRFYQPYVQNASALPCLSCGICLNSGVTALISKGLQLSSRLLHPLHPLPQIERSRKRILKHAPHLLAEALHCFCCFNLKAKVIFRLCFLLFENFLCACMCFDLIHLSILCPKIPPTSPPPLCPSNAIAAFFKPTVVQLVLSVRPCA